MAFILGVSCKISETRRPIWIKLWIKLLRIDPEIMQRHILNFRSSNIFLYNIQISDFTRTETFPN